MREHIRTILQQEYIRLGGLVFSKLLTQYLKKNKKLSEDQVKNLDAMVFMEGMMSGKFKTEWSYDSSEDEDYQKMVDIALLLNKTEKDSK